VRGRKEKGERREERGKRVVVEMEWVSEERSKK